MFMALLLRGVPHHRRAIKHVMIFGECMHDMLQIKDNSTVPVSLLVPCGIDLDLFIKYFSIIVS